MGASVKYTEEKIRAAAQASGGSILAFAKKLGCRPEYARTLAKRSKEDLGLNLDPVKVSLRKIHEDRAKQRAAVPEPAQPQSRSAHTPEDAKAVRAMIESRGVVAVFSALFAVIPKTALRISRAMVGHYDTLEALAKESRE